MILLVHLLLGAVVGHNIANVPLAILLALLCHYFLDFFPHVEYSVFNIKNKNWKKSLPDTSKVVFDFSLGMLVIFLFSKNNLIIYLCALVAIIPDGLTVISSVFPNKILQMHDKIHTEKIHYLTKRKKFPLFWRIATQVIVIIICIWLLK